MGPIYEFACDNCGYKTYLLDESEKLQQLARNFIINHSLL